MAETRETQGQQLIVKHEIFVIVNEKRVGPFFSDFVDGAAIKTKAGYALNTDLFRKKGAELIPVANDERIEIHDGEEFVDLPPTPVSG